MRFGEVFSHALVAVAVGCAVVVTWRVLNPPHPPPRPPEAVLSDEQWSELTAVGHRFGPVDAKVTVVEFGDFECGACRQFAAQGLPEVLSKYPNEVAVIYRHFPLPSHRFAKPSAQAAECAADQGQFKPYHDALFAKQDSLGVKSFVSYASDAGVPDLERFEQCVTDGRLGMDVVERDLALATGLELQGTPTLVINGTVVFGGSRMMNYVESALKETGRR